MSRRIPSLLSPPPGPQMMLRALRAAGLRFGSFPRSKKQSKVGWHSRESNRDVSIRIHNTRYGRQTEGDVIFCTASFLPPRLPPHAARPPAGPVPIPKHGVGAQEMLLAIEIAPSPAASPRRLSPLFVVAMGAAPVPRQARTCGNARLAF